MNTDALHHLFLECNSISTDTRKLQEGDLFFALKGDNFNGNTYAAKALEKGAKYAVIDDAAYTIPNKTILVADVLKSLQELANYHRRHLKVPIIALTGSNGKTTTKELINAVLSKQFKTTATIGNLNNHIGVPLTLLQMTTATEIGIVEMGANHQNEIYFLCQIAAPDYGLITNFGKAHLEGFGGVEGVIKGKSEMYTYLAGANKTIFVNADDAIQVEKTQLANTYRFGDSKTHTDVGIDFVDAQPFVNCKYNGLTIKSNLIGDYNYNNIAVAIAIGAYFKITAPAIKDAIEGYTPTNNRSQILHKGEHDIILDAYNANPTSMTAALHNLERQDGFKVAILGDMFELGDVAAHEHQNIANLAARLNIDRVILIGKNFNAIQPKGSKIICTEAIASLKQKLESLHLKNSTILIKGSRGMALERVLDIL
jgi:UDP-N-acetylmuramoyl-tripeptide--D-alanyl-D-alanine ligase